MRLFSKTLKHLTDPKPLNITVKLNTKFVWDLFRRTIQSSLFEWTVNQTLTLSAVELPSSWAASRDSSKCLVRWPIISAVLFLFCSHCLCLQGSVTRHGRSSRLWVWSVWEIYSYIPCLTWWRSLVKWPLEGFKTSPVASMALQSRRRVLLGYSPYKWILTNHLNAHIVRYQTMLSSSYQTRANNIIP